MDRMTIGNPTVIETLKSEYLEESLSYIYYAIVNWSGNGVYIAILWENLENKCHYISLGTGESTKKKKPTLYENVEISRREYLEFFQRILDADVSKIESPESITMKGEDFYFFMKLDSQEEISFKVTGSATRNSTINIIKEIFLNFVFSLDERIRIYQRKLKKGKITEDFVSYCENEKTKNKK